MDTKIAFKAVTIAAMIVATVITGCLAKKKKDRVMWGLAASMAACAGLFAVMT